MSKIKKAKQEIMQVVSQQKLPADVLQSVLENVLMQIEIASLHNNINMLNAQIKEMSKTDEEAEDANEDLKDTKNEKKEGDDNVN